MDNERTTPEGDTDDPLRELEQLATVKEDVEETSTRTKDGVIPSSYGAGGGREGS